MNREIKFRAWVPKGYTRWGGGGLVMLSWQDLLDDLHSELNPKKSVMGLGMSHAEEGVVFMQFTGLKDKNGKECFEGDIVRRVFEYTKAKKPKETVEVIVYRDEFGAFSFCKQYTSGIKGWSRTYSGHHVFPWEIIGNIYENPELLK